MVAARSDLRSVVTFVIPPWHVFVGWEGVSNPVVCLSQWCRDLASGFSTLSELMFAWVSKIGLSV